MIFGLNRYTIAIAAGFVLMAVLAGWGYKLYRNGVTACERKYEQSQLKANEVRVVTETQIMRLPKNEVQKLLEQKWCRDCS